MIREDIQERVIGNHHLHFKNGYEHKVPVRHIDDEIDLLELVVKIYRFLKKYYKLYLSSIVAGALLGVIYFFVQLPLYKSEMVFSTSFLQKSELNELVIKLNKYILEGNEAVYGIFDTNKIVEISLRENDENTTSHILSVVVTDPDYLPGLQQSIADYFNRNDYVKNKILTEKNRINNTLVMLNSEEVRLGELLSDITPASNANMYFQTSEMLKLKMEVQKERITLENQLKSLAAISVIQGFPKYQQPFNKNIGLILLIGASGALFLAMLYAFGLETKKYIANYEKTLSILKLNLNLAERQ